MTVRVWSDAATLEIDEQGKHLFGPRADQLMKGIRSVARCQVIALFAAKNQ